MISPLYKKAPTVIASLLKVSAHIEVGFVFCWIIAADKLGYRNGFIKFLSKRGFIKNAKSTYALYLITPVVTMLFGGLARSGLTYDFPEMVIDCSLTLMNITYSHPFIVYR